MIILFCNKKRYAYRRVQGHNQAKAVDEFSAGLEFAAGIVEMKAEI
jgi:hypothetical protein